MGRPKNKVVDLTPEGMKTDPKYRNYATEKTVCGHRVLEFLPTFYISLDQNFEAERYYAGRDDSSFSGWVVRSLHDRNWHTDPISNRQRALDIMAEMVEENKKKK